MIALNPDDPLRTFLDVALPPMREREKERHNIHLLLSLALVWDNWCIAKDNPNAAKAYRRLEPGREWSEYVGHNIGALLVSPEGGVVAYALNNNNLYASSAEHAEVRVVRKGIRHYHRLLWKSGKGLTGYATLLQGHTVYTTLESCSQCSGMMDLANMSAVVYAQEDPGQGYIGNVLYNMHRDEGKYGAPVPIRASFLPVFGTIQEAYRRFTGSIEGKDDAAKRTRPGVSGFLRSIEGAKAYRTAARLFDELEPKYLPNKRLLDSAKAFREAFNRTGFRDATLGG